MGAPARSDTIATGSIVNALDEVIRAEDDNLGPRRTILVEKDTQRGEPVPTAMD